MSNDPLTVEECFEVELRVRDLVVSVLKDLEYKDLDAHIKKYGKLIIDCAANVDSLVLRRIESNYRTQLAEEVRDSIYKEIDAITHNHESREFLAERILKIIRGD